MYVAFGAPKTIQRSLSAPNEVVFGQPKPHGSDVRDSREQGDLAAAGPVPARALQTPVGRRTGYRSAGSGYESARAGYESARAGYKSAGFGLQERRIGTT